MGLVLLLDMGRRGFDTALELERETGVPVFGALPLIRRGARSSRDDQVEAAVFTEAVQRAVARILPAALPTDGQVVGITSALPDEGKSTIGLALGRQLASRGRRVLLIHADLHKQLPPRFRDDCSEAAHDLVDLLKAPGRARAEDAVLRDRRSGLHVLAARAPDLEAARLLAAPAFRGLLDEARRSYEVVLIDTPPVLAVSDYAVIAGTADQLLFAVRWKTTSRRAVRAALREILATGLPLRGLILNQVELQAYRRQAPEDSLGFYRETSRYYR
jgi:Mrp family chromosome partitioning ATPase